VNVILGRSAIATATFTDTSTPPQPSDPPGVSFSMTDPAGVVTAATWTGPAPGTYGGAAGLSRTGTGTFQFVTVPTFAGGPWRWAFLSTGTSQPTEAAGSFFVISTAAYPYPFGYCGVEDVQARIVSGSWTPQKTGAWPNPQQVSDFILTGAVAIDTVLARSGYYVPLRPQVGQTIQPQAYQTLLDINAALATAATEKTRHGSQDTNEDDNAGWWLQYADDRIARLEAGDDNLAQFGLDGPFLPVADISLGMAWTGSHHALFTRHMDIV
jgi:hypothetical protein